MSSPFFFPIASPCISVSATKPYKQPISLFQLSTPNFTLQHTHLYTMHSIAIIASFLASLALSNAIKVESPNKDTVWQSNSPQTVEWTAVDTDPRNFSIQLVNQVSKFFADVSRQGWRQAGRRERLGQSSGWSTTLISSRAESISCPYLRPLCSFFATFQLSRPIV